MRRKLAVITFELVDESVSEKTDTIKKEIQKWFKEDHFPIPWVKRVKSVEVKERLS
ncbi:MAG: hypothetical protein QXZ68_07605 [Candidatus Bathyarchaeia archaeon]